MLLSPLSRLYSAIINVRNGLYEKDIFKSLSLGAPAISVGNITVGGTGKTPLVAFIAEILAENGEKPCILTRGYKRQNPKERVLVSDYEKVLADVKTAGDEPFELARKLLGKAVVIADANRAAAAKWALENFEVTAFVLDDAFQHRQARRDLDIVCIDAANPFGNEKILPSGILREPLENLKRADLIVITRANLAKNLSKLKIQSSKLNPDGLIFTAENKISDLTELEEFNAIPQSRPKSSGRQPRSTDRCLAFCALGNPDNFFEQLRQEDFNLISTQKFPDHHFYTSKDVEAIEEKAGQSGVGVLLTTAKDAVKLKDLNFYLPCYVIENKMIFDNEKKLRELIHAVFNSKSVI